MLRSSLAHELTCSRAHLLTSSLAHELTCSRAHLLTSSLAHELTCSRAHLLTCSHAHTRPTDSFTSMQPPTHYPSTHPTRPLNCACTQSRTPLLSQILTDENSQKGKREIHAHNMQCTGGTTWCLEPASTCCAVKQLEHKVEEAATGLAASRLHFRSGLQHTMCTLSTHNTSLSTHHTSLLCVTPPPFMPIMQL